MRIAQTISPNATPITRPRAGRNRLGVEIGEGSLGEVLEDCLRIFSFKCHVP